MTEPTTLEPVRRLWIHFRYVVGILLLVIVLISGPLVGYFGYAASDLTAAATVASILLAVISIVYGFVSHISTSNSLESIRGSHQSVESSAHLVRDSASTIAAASNAVNRDLASLAEKLERVTATVEDTRRITSDGYKSIEALKTTTAIQEKAPADSQSADASETLAERFYEATSVTGLYLLYAMSLSFKRQKAFSLRRVGQISNGSSESGQYEFGFAIAASSAGILEIRGTSLGKITCTSIKQPKGFDFEDAISSRAPYNDTDRYPDPVATVTKELRQIENLFAEKDGGGKPDQSTSGGG